MVQPPLHSHWQPTLYPTGTNTYVPLGMQALAASTIPASSAMSTPRASVLRYTLTIRKSQGQKLDKAVTDLGKRERAAGCTFAACHGCAPLKIVHLNQCPFKGLLLCQIARTSRLGCPRKIVYSSLLYKQDKTTLPARSTVLPTLFHDYPVAKPAYHCLYCGGA